MSMLSETPVLMTLDEFVAFAAVADDGQQYELDEGVLVTMSPTGYEHGRRITKIASYLDRAVDPERLIVVSGEVGLVMAAGARAIVRGMDIAVLEAMPDTPKGMLRRPPLLIVEVISPGNDPIDLERKRRQYQQFGVNEVWFVYNETRSLYCYRPEVPQALLYEVPQRFQSVIGVEVDTSELFR